MMKQEKVCRAAFLIAEHIRELEYCPACTNSLNVLFDHILSLEDELSEAMERLERCK